MPLEQNIYYRTKVTDISDFGHPTLEKNQQFVKKSKLLVIHPLTALSNKRDLLV